MCNIQLCFFLFSYTCTYTFDVIFFSIWKIILLFFCFAYTWNNYFNDVYWMSEMVGYPFISKLLYLDSIICLFYLFTYASVSVCIYFASNFNFSEGNCEYFHGTFRHMVLNVWTFNSVMNMLCMFSFFRTACQSLNGNFHWKIRKIENINWNSTSPNRTLIL